MLLLLLGACARSGSREPESVRSYPALPPPTGAVGEPGDEPVMWSTSAQWVAVCRKDSDRSVPRLLVGDDREVALDTVLAEDPLGRYLVISRDGQRILYDALRRSELLLGAVGETSVGNFDAEGRWFAYGRRSAGRDEVIVRTLATGAERVFESSVHPLSGVTLGSTGRRVWMSAWEYEEGEDEPERDSDMCATRHGCAMGWIARNVDNAVIDLEAPEPVSVRIDRMDPDPHAVGDEAVVETEEGIDLVSSGGRRRIAPRGCGVEHSDPRHQTLVITCPGDSETRDYFMWQDDELRPLDFGREGLAWARSIGRGPHPTSIVRGGNGRWLSLTGPYVVQGLATQVEGHAYDDRVLLVGEEAGVEIRDAASDTRVVHHDLRGIIDWAQGPYVALRTTSTDREGGWVIDVRDGRIVREYEQPALALSRSGHVAVLDGDGRLRWR